MYTRENLCDECNYGLLLMQIEIGRAKCQIRETEMVNRHEFLVGLAMAAMLNQHVQETACCPLYTVTFNMITLQPQ